MNETPFASDVVFTIGPAPVTAAVVTTWGIMAALALVAFLVTRRLRIEAGSVQSVAELFCGTVDAQIKATLQAGPARYRALVGTLFVFILSANWSSLVPGIEPPTAYLETDAALAFIVFVATIYFGVRVNGLGGYLKSFARPSVIMVPLNLVEQLTRTFSLMVRLFGNVMSGVFVVGIVLSLAGLLVPIPLMALHLLTGAIQAYIFAVLATVFIAAAVSENGAASNRSNTGES